MTWAYTDSYIGWAPVPASFDFSVTGYVGSPVVVSQSSYVFVPVNQFVGTNVSGVVMPAAQNAGILTQAHKTTHFSVADGVVHAGGPSAAFVERVSGKRVARASIGVAGHAIRPVKIAAAAGVVAGKRVRVTAPARERLVAAKGTKMAATKAIKATRVKEAKAFQKKEARPAKLARAAPGKGTKAERVKSAPPRQASWMTAPSRGKEKAAPKKVARLERKEPKRAIAAKPREEKRTAMAARSPRTEVRREKATAPPREGAPRIVEKQRVNPAPRAERREEGRMAAGAPRAEGPRPARAEAPPPRAEKPPPQAAPQNQPGPKNAPQGQPAPKKEKAK